MIEESQRSYRERAKASEDKMECFHNGLGHQFTYERFSIDRICDIDVKIVVVNQNNIDYVAIL